MKKLYVNGCSFTHGNVLPNEETWPVLLANELDLELFNESKNGQSMSSICYNTFMHLASFDPKETLVVIGLTWATRNMLQVRNTTVNIAPNNSRSMRYMDKVFNAGHPEKYFEESYDRHVVEESMIKEDILFDLLNSEFKKQRQLIGIHSGDELQRNQAHFHLFNIILLRSFLEQRGFKYKIIKFQNQSEYINPANGSISDLLYNHNLIEMWDRLQEGFIDPETSHPSSEGAIMIKDSIVRQIKQDQ